MNYKQMPIYLCSFTKECSERVKPIESIANHIFSEINNKTIIWPEKIDSETINPKNFNEIKKHFNLKELLFIDRIIGMNKLVSIINHVNRSGQNFLRGNTPEGKFPQFPDMSKIYNEINDFKTVEVHTIGKERFQRLQSNENVIWSELVGLIAPVAHYVGIKIYALGSENLDNIIKLF